jgi:hypothetical protein
VSQGDFEALVGTTGEPLVEVPQEVENAMLDVCKDNLPESRLQKADIGRLPLEDAQGQVGIPLDETQEGLGGDNAQVHLSGGPSKAGGMTPKGQASEEIAGSQQVHDEDTTPGIAISEFDESLFDHVNVGFF